MIRNEHDEIQRNSSKDFNPELYSPRTTGPKSLSQNFSKILIDIRATRDRVPKKNQITDIYLLTSTRARKFPRIIKRAFRLDLHLNNVGENTSS